MPTHDYLCPCCSHVTERFVEHGVDTIPCEKCAEPASKVFLSFPMAFVQPDVCYDSPIDGRPVTSKQARIEDLARSGCIPYDPEMKTDAARRRKEAEARLERAVDETVDAELERMPARKKERLAAELEGGMTAEPIRLTATDKPIRTELNG